jgi:hypothetical protein
MVLRESTPNVIVYGTFHRYPFDEARYFQPQGSLAENNR